jgi:hypothetical protein
VAVIPTTGVEILDGNIPVLKRKNIKKRIISIFELSSYFIKNSKIKDILRPLLVQ